MESYPVVFMKLGELGHALGVQNINRLVGCWEHQLDEHWWIALNGHGESMACSHGPSVPPYSAYVEFNGWPAGIVNAGGGTIAAGELANEDTLLAAMDAVIRGAVPQGSK